MRVIPKTIRSPLTNKEVSVFLPPSDASIDPEARTVTIEIDSGVIREMSAAILSMAVLFNKDPKERKRLVHDCAVFALACMTKDPQTGRPFYGDSGTQVGMRLMRSQALYSPEGALIEPVTQPDDILCITAYGSGMPVPGRFHMIARTSVDEPHAEHSALYISKFGSSGPAAIHDFSTAIDYYAATIASGVYSMTVLTQPGAT